MSALTQKLLETPLGKQLDASDAADLVGAAAERHIKRGQYLFRAGEAGYSLFVVLQGSFDVVLGQADQNETVVASVTAGHLVGELELMTQSARVASLLATDDSHVLEISGTRFDALLAENRRGATKLLAAMAKTLARRLASVNQRIIAKLPPKPVVEPKAKVAPPALPKVQMTDGDLDVLDTLWR